MGILELPMTPGALLDSMGRSHGPSCVSSYMDMSPTLPPAAFLPVGAGREGAGSVEVSILGLKRVLTLLPSASPENPSVVES